MFPMNASATVSIIVAGAAGRMGRRLVALAAETDSVQLIGATEAPGHELIGADSGQTAGIEPNGIRIEADPPASPPAGAVLIDFTVPEATRRHIDLCVERRLAMVIGTTGLTAADHAAIDRAAKSVPIVQAPNMSLGINLLLDLVARTAGQLGDDYDIEILEAHHRFKKDAPSGTAMALADSVCNATGKTVDADVVFTRHGPDDVRQPGKITMQTLRMGDVVGEHTVYFAGLGERIQLGHVATTRDTFVRGALRAAVWLHPQPPNRYNMKHVLGMT